MKRQISPQYLVLKFYAHQTRDGNWYGVCLNLNLAVEAESVDELKEKFKNVIISYIDTVLDTEDTDSIPDLLTRKAPFIDWLKYYYIKLLISVKNIPKDIVFKQSIPFHLADHC